MYTCHKKFHPATCFGLSVEEGTHIMCTEQSPHNPLISY